MKMLHMRAAVLRGPRQVVVEERELPEPGTGAVRVRLEGSGLCASSLPSYLGRPWLHYPMAPGAPGHEGWGTIEALGPAVSGVRLGDRVAVLSDAAFASHVVVDADTIVPLPRELDGQPFPGEALGCAMNIVRRSELSPGQTVAVIGLGFLGACVTRVASRRGCHVIAISRRDSSLDLGRRSGAALTVRLGDKHEVIDQVMAATCGVGAERVIECTGEQLGLDVAGEITRVRGRLVIAGYHQDGKRQVDLQLWNWRGLDVVNAHERHPAEYVSGIRAAVRAVLEGELQPSDLFTHRFPLGAVAAAFDLLAERPDGFVKALVSSS